MAQQGQREAQQKRELEASIQQIVQVHAQVANGDFSARVPLGQRDTLWEVAGALNNLLARLQRFRQDSLTLQQTNNAIARYFQARSQSGNGPFPWKPTGTAVDTLARQHNTLAQPASRLENPHDSLQRNNHMPFS
jgi:methyl-accepting chemotaxis protein